MKNKIYSMLVNRVPAIQKRYHAIRQQKNGKLGRAYAWMALMGMNVAWCFGKRKFGSDFMNPDENKKLPDSFCESGLSVRETPKELAERLTEYDIISFDIFDTLIYRPVSAPTDIFFFVGEKLKYLDFERIRREMEWRARQKAFSKTKSYEVTLEDIYREIEMQTGISCEVGMKAEIETEISMCFGNAYMLEVFQYLEKMEKTVVCTSDMYLPRSVIEQIVLGSGFSSVQNFFVSCEEKASKGNGTLFARVKENYGGDKKYIHVGDHPVSDVEQAKKAGFTSVFYQNANIAGMPYRAEDMSIMTGSLYRGIVNSRIHNGRKQYSPEYELGYIYSGIFVYGYCQWIHQYVKTHNIDKILFLARDGDILYRAYQIMYPNEADVNHAEYVYWSRLAATKMGAEYFKYDYLRRFIDHKVNQGYTLNKIFASMEIEDMLPTMCTQWNDFVDWMIASDEVLLEKNDSVINVMKSQKNMTPDKLLTEKNGWMIKEYLIAHWNEILSHYEEQLAAGKMYYAEKLKNCKRVVAVDIGWAGSGAVVLDYLVQQKWKLGCEIIGLVAGTNTIYNAEPNMSEQFLFGGHMESYLYSQESNRELWKLHDPAKGYNLIWEMLLESPNPTFKGFQLEKGEAVCCFGNKDSNQEGIADLQQGTLDFVADFHKVGIQKVIAGSDVYHAMVMLHKDNRKQVERIMKSFDQKMNVE